MKRPAPIIKEFTSFPGKACIVQKDPLILSRDFFKVEDGTDVIAKFDIYEDVPTDIYDSIINIPKGISIKGKVSTLKFILDNVELDEINHTTTLIFKNLHIPSIRCIFVMHHILEAWRRDVIRKQLNRFHGRK